MYSIDSGIVLNSAGEVSHPDLNPNRFHLGSNFISRNQPAGDDNSHGTMVTGIVAAERDNGQGIPGMTARTRVHVCKTIEDSGSGDESDFRDAVLEIVEAADAGGLRLVINYSAGGADGDSPALKQACRAVQQSGHLLCAAAGNEDTVLFPAGLAADFPSLIAVGGCDKHDGVVGPVNPLVGISAPARNVRSTKPNNIGNGDFYDTGTGTSLAAPFVTGLAALIWSKHPDWTAAQVKNRILATARIAHRCRVIDAQAALAG